VALFDTTQLDGLSDAGQTFDPIKSRLGVGVVTDIFDLAPTPPPLDSEKETKAYEVGKGPPDSKPRQVVSVEPGASCPTIPGFRLKKQVGEGGFGEVWESSQAELGRHVAIKRLREALSNQIQDQNVRQMLEKTFRYEAIIAASLEHPNIVPIHALGEDSSGSPLLAMKLVRGETWEKILSRDFKRLPAVDYFAKHIPILIAVARAVSFAHARGIVHRDLKPSQVMVGEFGETLLMDWGLGLVFDGASFNKSIDRRGIEELLDNATTTGPAGTPAFMAPEQTMESAEQIGPWTDIYLLGGTLYYILTGKTPHGGRNAQEAFAQATLGYVDPPAPVVAGRQLPVELTALALEAMAMEPPDRVPSAQHFIEELEYFLSGANKRVESMELTLSVKNSIEENTNLLRQESSLDSGSRARGGVSVIRDYKDYTSALTTLENARALWPQNPEVDGLHERLIVAYAMAALSNDDLTLARILADQVKSPDNRAAIEARLELREKREVNQARQRFVLKGVLVAFFLIQAFLVYQVRSLLESTIAINARLQTLLEGHAEFQHLDEVLTMSARMAAQTGDESWGKRHKSHAIAIDRRFAAMKVVVQGYPSQAPLETMFHANERLSAIEVDAIRLANEKRLPEAQARMNSQEYGVAKQQFQYGLADLGKAIQSHTRMRLIEHISGLETFQVVIILLATLVGGLMILIWTRESKEMRRLQRRGKLVADRTTATGISALHKKTRPPMISTD